MIIVGNAVMDTVEINKSAVAYKKVADYEKIVASVYNDILSVSIERYGQELAEYEKECKIFVGGKFVSSEVFVENKIEVDLSLSESGEYDIVLMVDGLGESVVYYEKN